MKIFFIGDVFGRPGRQAVKKNLPKVIEEYQPDLVVANIENLAGGKGATIKTLKEMQEAGVDVFTGGNHIFQQPEIFDKKITNLVRPANYPEGTLGIGHKIFKTKNKQNVLVINLLGRVFVNTLLDCPFRKTEEILVKSDEYDAVIVDFHAEATSEKSAYKWYFDNKLTAIFGTHTHIATADYDITKNGTFYVSDVGMTGPIDSVIGIKKQGAFGRFLHAMPIKFSVATGRTIFQGFLLDISNKKTQTYQRIEIIEE